jgi:hypothetical protein
MGKEVLAIALTPISITTKSQSHIAAYAILMKIQDKINENEGYKNRDLYEVVTALLNGQVGANPKVKPPPLVKGAPLTFAKLLKPLCDHAQVILGTTRAKDAVLKDLQTLLSALLKGIEDDLAEDDEATRARKAEE